MKRWMVRTQSGTADVVALSEEETPRKLMLESTRFQVGDEVFVEFDETAGKVAVRVGAIVTVEPA